MQLPWALVSIDIRVFTRRAANRRTLRSSSREEVPLALAAEAAIAEAGQVKSAIAGAAALGKVGVGEVQALFLLVVALIVCVLARR